MKVFTDVKINLGLNVLRKREDGYHDIETVFYPWDGMGDTLEIEPSGEFSIEISGPTYTGWDPQKDLTARAWRLMAEERGLPPVHIRLEKTAPVGAGLGGGSSDAVAALKMLNEMFSLDLPAYALVRYARQLGSDCPFFVYDAPRLAQGRGDILNPVKVDLSAYEIRVEVPAGVAVSTAEAYQGIVPGVPDISIAEIVSRPVEDWKMLLRNDFEDSVFPAHPEIRALKERFYEQGAVYASMTGSGSAVYGIFPLK